MADAQVCALLQDAETLEIRAYEYTTEAQYGNGQEFWWTKGNAACDCNRHLFFERMVDPEYDDDHLNDGDGFPCGKTRYRLLGLTVNDVNALETTDVKE